MKNILYISLALLIFSSCKDDAPAPTPTPTGTTNNGIYGTWNLNEVRQENGKMELDEEPYGTFYATSSNETGTLVLNKDGSFTSRVGYTQTFYYTIYGIEQEQSGTLPPTTTTGTFTYDSTTNEFISTNSTNGLAQKATVLELTKNKLVYEYPVYQVQNEQGIKQETWMDVITTFVR